MSHVREHCGTPKITRSWKNLGEGATWTCSCSAQFRLTQSGGYDGPFWAWRGVEK